MSWFKSILSEKSGKGSAKRIAGLFASFVFLEIVHVVIYFSLVREKEIANQTIILKVLEYSFIIVAVALVGIAVPTLTGLIRGALPNFTTNQREDEKVG